MKKYLTVICATFVLGATSLFAGVTLIFDDSGAAGGTATSGEYAPGDTIFFNISINYTGSPPSDLDGLTLWFQSMQGSNPAGGLFTINGINRTGSLFSEEQGSGAGVMDAGPGGNNSRSDAGAFQPASNPLITNPGAYFVGTISLTISGPVVVGQSYTIESIFAPSSTDPEFSFGTVAFNRAGDQGVDVPSAAYTVTVVAEPATWSYIAFGGILALGLNRLRARHRC